MSSSQAIIKSTNQAIIKDFHRLQKEREIIQKKTFTKWINSHLAKANLVVNDLYVDLIDGKMLIKLLELISGEIIGEPNIGKIRVQKIENVNQALNFTKTKVMLGSIGAEDIVDGNPRLILGLMWTIRMRFELQNIENGPQRKDSGVNLSAKEALLFWCQYHNEQCRPAYRITNFTYLQPEQLKKQSIGVKSIKRRFSNKTSKRQLQWSKEHEKTLNSIITMESFKNNVTIIKNVENTQTGLVECWGLLIEEEEEGQEAKEREFMLCDVNILDLSESETKRIEDEWSDFIPGMCSILQSIACVISEDPRMMMSAFVYLFLSILFLFF